VAVEFDGAGDPSFGHLDIHLDGIVVSAAVEFQVYQLTLLRYTKERKSVSFEYLNPLHIGTV